MIKTLGFAALLVLTAAAPAGAVTTIATLYNTGVDAGGRGCGLSASASSSVVGIAPAAACEACRSL